MVIVQPGQERAPVRIEHPFTRPRLQVADAGDERSFDARRTVAHLVKLRVGDQHSSRNSRISSTLSAPNPRAGACGVRGFTVVRTANDLSATACRHQC